MATFNKDLVVKQGLNVSSDVVFTKQNTESAGVTWTTQTSNFGVETIRSVAYGNGVWVAGGTSANIRTSTDTITWTTQTSNFGTQIQSLAYGNNLWVAGGYTGNIRTSTDTITWTTQTSNFGNTQIRSVAYGNSLWVAVGNTGQIRTSTDTVTWTTQTSNFGNSIVLSVAYGNNLWVAGGQSGQIRTSTDTITWTTRTPGFGSNNIWSVAYGNNLWLGGGASGDLRGSTDGITWSFRVANFGSTQISSIAYGNSLWILGGYGGYGGIRTSTDGTTWITRTSNFGDTRIWSVAYGNNLWVAGGQTGQLRTSSALSTSFTNKLTSPALSQNVTITLPSSTTTLIGASSTDTLTNKTISGSNNTITNISLTTGVTGTLPVANGGTGITSFGAGVATFLGTPSSANLASAITDETGSGALVFATSPSLAGTPTAPTAAANTNTTQIATTAFVLGQGNSTAATITALGTQAAGSSNLYARADHVHPTTGLALLTGATFTGQIQSTLANNANTGSGQIYLNGATGNRIDFNTNGLAAPAFNTRSTGAKLVLYPNMGAATTDYAIGIDTNTMWFSVTGSSNFFRWYGGTTNTASLSGAGALTLSSTISATGLAGSLLTSTVGTNLGIASAGTATVPARADHVHPTTGLGLTASGLNQFASTTSAELAGVISDETGSGSLVFGTSPIIATPTLTLSTSTSTTDGRIAWDSTNDKIIIGDGTTAREFASSTLITNAQVGTSYTLVLADKDKMIELNNASAITLNIPTNTVDYPVGTQINIMQTGAGQVTIAAGTPATTTVNGTPGLKLRAQWSSATLIKRATETWVAVGDLAE